MLSFNNFKKNIGPRITLTDLIHCKQGVNEKMTDFIGRYKYLHSQVAYPMPNHDVQRICIANLQKDIRDKLLFSKFTSFTQLCAVLRNNQLQVSPFC